MTEMKQRPLCEGAQFRSIRDGRFKTVLMSVHFLLPLRRETVAENAILPFLLTRATQQYPDFTKLNEHLAELYGASLDADTERIGDAQALTVSASAIADRYALNGERLSDELSELLCGVCFDPLLEDGLFPEDGFEQERRQLMETLDAEFNDKRVYALRRCEEVMCADEPFGVGRCGTKEGVRRLRRESLTPAWDFMIHHARTEVMVLGNCNPEPVYRRFAAAFRKLGRAAAEPCPMKVVRKAGEPKSVTERMDVAQSKLVMGFRTGAAGTDEAVPAFHVMSALFGATPTSKLFLNVREKMSLCYYCSSSYNSNKGILEVQSGVERKDAARAKEEILAQLEAIRGGAFTDAEVDDTKRYLNNLLHSCSDSLGAMEYWYLMRTFSDPDRTPERQAELISAVTRDDIIRAAENTTLDTVYLLTGNGGEA